MTDKTGGPAFPSHGSMGEVTYEGMTMRDYAAIKAMAAMLSNENVIQRMAIVGKENMVDPDVLVATGAYKMADAMIAERSKGE